MTTPKKHPVSEFTQIGKEARGLCISTMGITAEGFVFPVRCKQWSCPVCAPLNAYRWAIEVVNGMDALRTAGCMIKFVTITQPGSIKTPEYAYRILHNQWGKFQNRWRRWCDAHAIPLIYAAFVEGQPQRDLMPHFHILAAWCPPEEDMRRWCVKSGLGYECKVESTRTGHSAGWYVSKYSTKGTEAAAMPKGFRRVRISENWPRLVWQNDLRETTAIIKKPGEGYLAWAHRASPLIGMPVQEIVDKAMELSAQNFSQQQDDIVVGALYDTIERIVDSATKSSYNAY